MHDFELSWARLRKRNTGNISITHCVIMKTAYIVIRTTGFPQRKGKSFDSYYPYTDSHRYNSSRIVQLLICSHDDETNQGTDEISMIIKPEGFLIPSLPYHPITTSIANQNGVIISDVFDSISDLLLSCTKMVMYNANFTLHVLQSELYRLRRTVLIEHINSMSICCLMLSMISPMRLRMKYGDLKTPTVKEAYVYLLHAPCPNYHTSANIRSMTIEASLKHIQLKFRKWKITGNTSDSDTHSDSDNDTKSDADSSSAPIEITPKPPNNTPLVKQLGNPYTVAAKDGNIELLKQLQLQHVPCKYDATTCAGAAENGSLDILQWLRSQYPPCHWDTATCWQAARKGHLHVLQWVRAQKPPCPWDTETCWQATISNHLNILQWVRMQCPPCPWDVDFCYKTACSNSPAIALWISVNNSKNVSNEDDSDEQPAMELISLTRIVTKRSSPVIWVTTMAKYLGGAKSRFDAIMQKCFLRKPKFRTKSLHLSKLFKPMLEKMRKVDPMEAGYYIDHIIKIILLESEVKRIPDTFEYCDSGDRSWLTEVASKLPDPFDLIDILSSNYIIRERDIKTKCLNRRVVIAMLSIVSQMRWDTYQLLVRSIRRLIPSKDISIDSKLSIGPIIGYPDIITGDRIIDIKTGKVHDNMDEITIQLLCYSALFTNQQMTAANNGHKINEIVIVDYLNEKIHRADVSYITSEQYTALIDYVSESNML